MEMTRRRLDSTISRFASWLLSIQRCSMRTSFLKSSSVRPAASSRFFSLRRAAASFSCGELVALSARNQFVNLFFKRQEAVIGAQNDLAEVFNDVVAAVQAAQVSLRANAAFFNIFVDFAAIQLFSLGFSEPAAIPAAFDLLLSTGGTVWEACPRNSCLFRTSFSVMVLSKRSFIWIKNWRSKSLRA